MTATSAIGPIKVLTEFWEAEGKTIARIDELHGWYRLFIQAHRGV